MLKESGQAYQSWRWASAHSQRSAQMPRIVQPAVPSEALAHNRWEGPMRRLIVTGIVVTGLTIPTAFAEGTQQESARVDTWQRAVETCLGRHAQAKACRVVDGPRIWCPSSTPKTIPEGCTIEGNAALRPQRRVIR